VAVPLVPRNLDGQGGAAELTVVGDLSGDDSASTPIVLPGSNLQEVGALGDRPPARSRIASIARLGVLTTDAVIVGASMALAYGLWALSAQAGASLLGAAHYEGPYRRLALVALPVWILVFRRYRLYNSRHLADWRDEAGRIVHAVGISAMLTAGLAHLLDLPVAKSWLVTVWPVATVAMLLERQLMRRGFAALRQRGYCLRPVVIAGTGPEAEAMVKVFEEKPELGYCVVGLLGERERVADGLSERLPLLDPGAKVAEQVRLAGASGVVVATTEVDQETSNRLIRTLTDAGIHVELSSSLKDIDASRLSVRPLGCFPVLYVEAVRRGGWRPVAKRIFDLVVATIAMILALPVLALAAVLVKVSSHGPVLFRQERVGYRGRRFQILKLRSMYVDADQRLKELVDGIPDGPVPKIQHDPRVTPVGRVLRKLSIDELPQLVNVLRGEMSLVGPRPEQPSEVKLWAPELFSRLRVRPGLTGVWQVNGRSIARDSKDRWDLYYVDNWSIWHDLAILVKTVPVVVRFKGAY
jgi:exopolysaccharide biosynthesis polyprenyl glycosylphosphotransferase